MFGCSIWDYDLVIPDTVCLLHLRLSACYIWYCLCTLFKTVSLLYLILSVIFTTVSWYCLCIFLKVSACYMYIWYYLFIIQYGSILYIGITKFWGFGQNHHPKTSLIFPFLTVRECYLGSSSPKNVFRYSKAYQKLAIYETLKNSIEQNFVLTDWLACLLPFLLPYLFACLLTYLFTYYCNYWMDCRTFHAVLCLYCCVTDTT